MKRLWLKSLIAVILVVAAPATAAAAAQAPAAPIQAASYVLSGPNLQPTTFAGATINIPAPGSAAGKTPPPSVILKKGSDNGQIFDWYQRAVHGTAAARMTVNLVALAADGTVLKTYVLVNAWPTKVTANTKKAPIVYDSFTLAFDMAQ